jgi:hypothetical protein
MKLARILLAAGLVALCAPAAADYIQTPLAVIGGSNLCVVDGPGTPNSPKCSPTVSDQAPWRETQFTSPAHDGPLGALAVAPNPVIDTGSIAGQALTWVVTVGGGAIATMLTGLIYKLLQKAGVQMNDALRARLQEMVLNGLNAGAKAASEQLAGKGQVVIKQAALANAVTYVQAHGADTIKKLGLDPTSPEAVEAIKARIETAIADPTVATPKVLDAAAADAPAPPAGSASAALASRAAPAR